MLCKTYNEHNGCILDWSQRWCDWNDQGTLGVSPGPQCPSICGGDQDRHVSPQCTPGDPQNVTEDSQIPRVQENPSHCTEQRRCGVLGHKFHIRKVCTYTQHHLIFSIYMGFAQNS